MAARQLAVRLVAGVLIHKRPLESVLTATSAEVTGMPPRDRALARSISATALRRRGELEHVLDQFLERRPPGNLWPILLTGAAQLVCLKMSPHAVVDLTVEAIRRDRGAHRFAKLANAVLRRVAERGAAALQQADTVRLNMPQWLWQSWVAAYGEDTARRIAEASLSEAPLDISLKPGSDAASWAERLGGRVLPSGSIRLTAHGRVEELPGYAEGNWWVQDAAAALVARAAGDVAGRTIADLCAAPGGKTAALAAAGALVTAVDTSTPRLGRLSENLRRLRLDADLVEADAATWSPGRTFDAVVLDAPCTATGTIRRHPDILHLKQPQDVARMAAVQVSLLNNAARLVREGGTLIYSTCSLQPEEGPEPVAAFLAAHADFERAPIAAGEIRGEPSWITANGDVRTLPCHLPLEPPELSGMDGFFVARLRRKPA